MADLTGGIDPYAPKKKPLPLGTGGVDAQGYPQAQGYQQTGGLQAVGDAGGALPAAANDATAQTYQQTGGTIAGGTTEAAGAGTTTAGAATGGGGVDPFAASGGGQFIGGGWIPNNNPAAIAAAKAAAGQVGTTATGAGTTAAAGGDLGGSYRAALLKMLNGADPSMDDPALKSQAAAFSVGQTRAKDRAREMLAERAGSLGGNSSGMSTSGSFDQGLVGLDQAQGEAEAANRAGLLGTAYRDRQQQLMQAAAMAGQTLSGEEARALQEKLGMTQAEIQRMGIESQSRLGQGELALRGELGRGGLSLGLLQALLGNKQHGESLGATLGMFGANQSNSNLQALLNMFGGGA